MRNIITLIFCLTISLLHAQQAVLTAGSDANSNGGSTSYSIGQTAYLTKTGNNTSITEGVQQPYEISVTVGVDETTINLEMSVYPNPTTDYLTLNVENSKGLTYHLYDAHGRIIKKEKITGKNTHIHLDKLASATYFLSVRNKNRTLKTFKIIKK